MSNPAPPTEDPSNADRTASLLNLLKFSAPSPSPQPHQQAQHQAHQDSQPSPHLHPQYQHNTAATQMNYDHLSSTARAHSIHGRGISASDLVASFMGKTSTPSPREGPRDTTPKPLARAATPAATSGPRSQGPSTSANHQEFLLKLLNRSSAPASERESLSPRLRSDDANASSISQGRAETGTEGQHDVPFHRKDSPIRVFGNKEDDAPTPFEPRITPQAEPAPKKDGIFTYVNPFEQLAASSPRNTKAKSPTPDFHKRKMKEPSPAHEHAGSRRKLTPAGQDVLQSIESPAPAAVDGRTPIEALMGIGAPTRDPETVAEALNEVGSKVDREVENALANAEEKEKQVEIKKEELERAQEETIEAMAESAHEMAVDIKHELDKEENKSLLEDELTTPVAEAVKDIIDDAAQERPFHDSETAETAESRFRARGERIVPVYQFPMKPFVAIDITAKDVPKIDVREDSVVDVARFKKEFDQIDRTLVTATNDIVIYAVAAVTKPGGIRVIHQDDGDNQQIFKSTRDRIFNVCISTAHPQSPLRGIQNVIATGVSGAVYWATVVTQEDRPFQAEVMEKEGLIIPPSVSQVESPSTGQLKTRAKKSNRHPEFFGIGRGKSIHIIFPAHARTSTFVSESPTVDTDGYFQDRTLRITTGKASKDFVFSEDDTVIATLDKAGRLKIWDIRDLVDENNATASRIAPVDIKTPILSFATIRASEKSWPTSILFVDKLRAYQKGIAQRYILIGMKQNHTLQLWDLCLNKVVQELNFPHDQETDAICSIAYHPSSQIIVLGHPTRNSLYFIHLSAPRYNLQPTLSQAQFAHKLVANDSSLPKTEVTAIMSGIREYSLSSIGQLRSMDLLPSNGEPTKPQEDDDSLVFELYVMHSRGVTCLNIKKEDLGWSNESKVLNPVKAESEGLVLVRELRQPGPSNDTLPVNGDNVPPAVPQANSKSKSKKSDLAQRTPASPTKTRDIEAEGNGNSAAPADVKDLPAPEPTSSGPSEKAEKKKKKRAAAAVPQPAQVETPHPAPPTADSYATTAPRGVSPQPERRPQPIANGDSISLGISGDFLDKELKKIEVGVSTEFNKVLGRELETLYRRIDDDKRVQDAAGTAKQDAMLRLVSKTLSENVDKTLNRIIQTNIKDAVIPAIADVMSTTLDKRLTEALTQQLQHALPAHLKLALPEAVSRSLQKPDVLRVLSDQVTNKLTGHVEKEFLSTLHNTITPSFKNLALNVAQKTSVEVQDRVKEQLRQADTQRRDDMAKIDDLTKLVRRLSETMNTMAAAQSEFQQEILKLQSLAAQDRQAHAILETSRRQQEASRESSRSALQPMTPEQAELNAISRMMAEKRYEEAMIQVCYSLVPHLPLY